MKRLVSAWLMAGMFVAGAQVHAAEAPPAQVRIGYQKGSVSMVLAKEHRLLETRFPHTTIQWIEFPAGPDRKSVV